MPKYRKTPIVIDAEKWEGNNLNNPNSLFQSPNVIIKDDGSEFIVSTPEGTMTGKVGEYLIRGVKGEFYPCQANIFEAIYEKV